MSLQIDFSLQQIYKASLLQQLSLISRNHSLFERLTQWKSPPGRKGNHMLGLEPDPDPGTTQMHNPGKWVSELQFSHLKKKKKKKGRWTRSHLSLAFQFYNSTDSSYWDRGQNMMNKFQKIQHKSLVCSSVICYLNVFWVLWQLPKKNYKTS